VHEGLTVDSYPDVRGRPAGRVEEDQITRPEIVNPDLPARCELRGDRSWRRNAVAREHVPHETAAIESGGVGATVPVRNASQGKCGRDQISTPVPTSPRQVRRRQRFSSTRDRERLGDGACRGARRPSAAGEKEEQRRELRSHVGFRSIGQLVPDRQCGRQPA
jgi:hypothetical protein